MEASYLGEEAALKALHLAPTLPNVKEGQRRLGHEQSASVVSLVAPSVASYPLEEGPFPLVEQLA